MTSFYKPTPPDQEGPPPEKQEQPIQGYTTPAGAQGAKPGTTPGSVARVSPAPTNPEQLPTGLLPANYTNDQPGQNRPPASLLGSGLRPLNQFSPTPSRPMPENNLPSPL